MKVFDTEQCETIADLRRVIIPLKHNNIEVERVKVSKKLWHIILKNLSYEKQREYMRSGVIPDIFPLVYDEWKEVTDLKVENGIIYRRVE